MSYIQITLEAARVNAGLTQKEVAEKLGVSVVSLIHWEKGNRKPRIEMAQKLCELYNLELDHIKW